MAKYNRFITLLGRPLKSPIVLASMAGITDAAYVRERENHVGLAFLGGYSIDEPSISASKTIESEGRKEFSVSFDEILAEIKQFEKSDILVGLNLRGSRPEAYLKAAEFFGKDVIYEIDAHCRQKPMTDAGCGEALLSDIPRLVSIVSSLESKGYAVSVKFRCGIVNDAELANTLWKAGAEILHVDLMDFGHHRLKKIRNSCPITIIGNNGVDSPEVMMDYFSHGADLVSLARQAHPDVLEQLNSYIQIVADEVGWYNAPKQLCRGGDYRSLAFCCMPMKQCPLLPTLDAIGMEHEEYTELKMSAVAGTPLAEGASTCFGSLAFCCKSSTPCMYRQMAQMQENLPNAEYMKLKRHLADIIMAAIFHEE